MLYDLIDQSDFYQSPVLNKVERSICNVVFTSPSKELDALFVQKAEEKVLNQSKAIVRLEECEQVSTTLFQ